MTFLKSITVHQFGDASALVLTAFRVIAAGADHSDLEREFDARFDIAGRAALGALHMLVREVGTIGARRVTIACPGCCRLTGDELSVLALLKAAQARDRVLVDAHIAWLLAGRHSQTARAAAMAIGGLFAGAGLTFDEPAVELSAPLRAPGRAAVRAVGNA